MQPGTTELVHQVSGRRRQCSCPTSCDKGLRKEGSSLPKLSCLITAKSLRPGSGPRFVCSGLRHIYGLGMLSSKLKAAEHYGDGSRKARSSSKTWLTLTQYKLNKARYWLPCTEEQLCSYRYSRLSVCEYVCLSVRLAANCLTSVSLQTDL